MEFLALLSRDVQSHRDQIASRRDSLQTRVQNLLQLAPVLSGYAVVLLAFAAFVVLNGGIVVGDRSAHEVARHWAQPCYFAAFAAASLFAWLPTGWKSLRRAPRGATAAAALAATAAAAAAIHFGTVAHPYLLADNRHYTFYLWKNLLAPLRHLRPALAPGYAAAALLLSAPLATRRGALWTVALWLSAAAALEPAGLLELRYFTAPLMMTAVNAPLPPPRWLAVQAAAAAAVNGVTIYVFAARPFPWGDGSTARFMW